MNKKLAKIIEIIKKDRIIIGSIVGIVFVGLIFLVTAKIFNTGKTQETTSQYVLGSSQEDMILYFGQECAHCKVVEKFIKDNDLEKKLIFVKKEVWHNAENNAEFQMKAKECLLDSESTGVPFLYARGKCYVGEVDVQNFFKKEAGMQP